MILTTVDNLFRALELADPEVSVVLTDNASIQQLNRQWRHQDKATDVLSFPLHEPEAPAEFGTHIVALGDIVISLEYAEALVDTSGHHVRVADELDVDPSDLSWTLDDEVQFLFIHGLLHLVGFRHTDGDQQRQMKAQEKRLWQAI